MKTIFYVCPICGNVIVKLADSGVVPSCCGSPMHQLTPNVTDVGEEKHVPVVGRIDDWTICAEIGSIPHPMTEEHYIHFIYLETEHGAQLRYLKPGDNAAACFCCKNDKPVAIYEYCNKHGLWKTANIPDIKSKKQCPMH